MRHFRFLSDDRSAALFAEPPGEFGPDDPIERLAPALGATLYCPATRPGLAADLARRAADGATSMALCLEDAVAAQDVTGAEANLVAGLRELHARGDEAPLLFVRVRRTDQIADLTHRLGAAADLLTGFVLPKVTPAGAVEMLEAVESASAACGRPLRAMPVVETPQVLRREQRGEALAELARVFTKFRDRILAIRLGATDLCGLHGIRRTRTMTVYDVKVVADVIADVVNVLGRPDEGWTITGPVWEYFDPTGPEAPLPRGLMREVELDRANGLAGKTAIHPSQLGVVHGMSVVSAEDHADAQAVLLRAGDDGGVFAGARRDRMNEAGPHHHWARGVLARADLFGVARPGVEVDDLVHAVRR